MPESLEIEMTPGNFKRFRSDSGMLWHVCRVTSTTPGYPILRFRGTTFSEMYSSPPGAPPITWQHCNDFVFCIVNYTLYAHLPGGNKDTYIYIYTSWPALRWLFRIWSWGIFLTVCDLQHMLTPGCLLIERIVEFLPLSEKNTYIG